MDNQFEQLAAGLAEGGVDAVFDHLAGELLREKKYHELFDARLMQARCRLGLPAILTASLDDLEEPLRSQVEGFYLKACKEVGDLLLAEKRVREAWMYLRPLGEKSEPARVIEQVDADEDNVEELVEIALAENVHPVHGFKLVLQHFGTCSAITTFEAEMTRRPPAQRQAAAEMLVRRLHGELIEAVRDDIGRQTGTRPPENRLAELLADRDWLMQNNNYHTDATHLASIVRFARQVENPEALALALDLTEYGRRLGPQFQFPGDEPFADLYVHHGLFFQALLGERVDEALKYFGERAEAAQGGFDELATAEVYVGLLARLGRYPEAIDAHIELIPAGTRTVAAPTLLELSRTSGSYDRLMEVCRQRGDLLGFTAGMIEKQKAEGGRRKAEVRG